MPFKLARILLGLVFLFLPGLSTAASKPNILLIVADDMGYGDLSCFGSRQIATPNIDALAATGIRATTGYVSGAVCAPSRAGLMTGRYQERFGFEHNLAPSPTVTPEALAVPKDERMMPAYLKEAGYATALIGKWHLGGSKVDWHHPLARGFDYYFGRYGGHGHFPTVKSKSILRGREPVTRIEIPYTTDWYTQEAIDFIDRTPAEQPWFLYLAHDTPHTPLQAKEEDIARFKHIKDKKRRIYAAMQHCLDENIGKLVAHLKIKGQLDNTLIVFLSDNGGPTTDNASVNAPFNGQKALVLDGGVRVPYIFSWPAKLAAGETYHEPFISLDLLPTFLAAAGIDRKKV
ncbi:MAG: sulfatase-like hydrolase/transferase, partial [Verrucomicrobiae bacterium]|nr:sulfatase-like hydrolase/transferase [Verrucomicrobiae bacterium]NNJ86286.1 sulfatase-like hydrolase/transferase [Akkermansiaceae bacterium]